MKINEVKRLAEQYSLAELQAAAAAFEEGEPITIEVHGDDEGEQLTHLLSAAEILEQVATGTDFKDAYRAFAKRVRDVLNP
jgi:phosphotransferase system HPr-like phosphotransfer protein